MTGEREVRDAFDRLRTDAARVDTMAALHARESSRAPRRLLAAVAGVAVVALAVVGGIVAFGGDDDAGDQDLVTEPRPTVAPDPTPESTAEAAPTASAADPTAEPTATPIAVDEVPTRSGFGAFPCFSIGPVDATAPAETAPDHIRRAEFFDDGDCRRTVFVLGAGLRDGTVGEAVSPGDAFAVTSIEGFPGTAITLPDDFLFDVEGPDLMFTEVGVSAVTQDADGTLHLYVDHGGDDVQVTFLPSPARIVVDTRLTGAVAAPVTGEVVLPRPIAPTLVGETVEVAGLARPFEATGAVSLRRAPAEGAPEGSGEPVDAVWTGFEVRGDGFTGSDYGYSTASTDAWGTFTIAIGGLRPGSYELLFESFAPEESGSAGTYVTFVVTPAAVIVEPDGLAYADPENGAIRRLAFGTAARRVVDALDTLLGESGVASAASPECPTQVDRTVLWEGAGLSIDLRDGEVIAWSLRPGSELTTLTGVGLGSSRAELEESLVVEVFESTLGTEFGTGGAGLGGLLSGTRPRATITNLWAGEICAFR